MRIVGNPPSGGKKPTTPTIGTATDGGTGTTVSVAFTPSTYIGKGTITYTATSSPGSLTGTGSGSPITVSGLTTGTAYTFTVKGDTNYGVASDYSAASNSVTPASPSSFESIATFTANGTVATYTFSSIPSTYKSLQIRFLGRNTFGVDTGSGNAQILFNSDSSASYVAHFLVGDGTSAYGNNNTGATALDAPIVVGGGNTSNVFGGSIIDIIDYASTSKFKTAKIFSGFDKNGSNGLIQLSSGLWRSTAAISSISVRSSSANWETGSVIALYGIK